MPEPQEPHFEEKFRMRRSYVLRCANIMSNSCIFSQNYNKCSLLLSFNGSKVGRVKPGFQQSQTTQATNILVIKKNIQLQLNNLVCRGVSLTLYEETTLITFPCPPLPVLVAEVSSISRNSAQLLPIAAQSLRRKLQLMKRNETKRNKCNI